MMMLRLSEQFLIRAEAEAEEGYLSNAAADLNVVRQRAGLPISNANTQPALLTAILHERQIELFTELGQRWLDLKRTNSIDSIMVNVTPIKANGAGWNSYQQLYPITILDIQTDPNVTQNLGY